MDAVSPVVTGLEQHEHQLGAGQPQYNPLPVLRYAGPEGKVLHRWRFTIEERAAIASGADLFVTNLTFNNPFQPISLAIVPNPNKDYFEQDLQQREWQCGKCIQIERLAKGEPIGELLPLHHRFCAKRGA